MIKKWIVPLLSLTSLIYAKSPEVPPPAYDADLFKKDTPALSFDAGFLFWRVQEGATNYALKMEHEAPSTTYAQGKFHSATFNGKPGFRVTAHYFRAPRFWEIWGQYTRLSAHGKNHVGVPDSGERYLTATLPLGSTAMQEADSYIHMNYNVTDLLVDRYFSPNPHLRIRFLGGGSVAWINQTWQLDYKTVSAETIQVRNQWQFIGGGLRLGCSLDWFLDFWNLYFTSSTTCATFLGTYDNQSKQITSTQTLPVGNTHFSDVRPVFAFQAMFGPSWQKNFTAARMEIFAGYEINTWFNLHEIYNSTSGSPESSKPTWITSGLVALQGLTTRMTVDF